MVERRQGLFEQSLTDDTATSAAHFRRSIFALQRPSHESLRHSPSDHRHKRGGQQHSDPDSRTEVHLVRGRESDALLGRARSGIRNRHSLGHAQGHSHGGVIGRCGRGNHRRRSGCVRWEIQGE